MRLIGDIDGDGKIDISDLALLKRVLKEEGYLENLLDKLPLEDKARLDVNQDSQINQEDIVKLCQILLQEDASKAEALASKFIALRQKVRP